MWASGKSGKLIDFCGRFHAPAIRRLSMEKSIFMLYEAYNGEGIKVKSSAIARDKLIAFQRRGNLSSRFLSAAIETEDSLTYNSLAHLARTMEVHGIRDPDNLLHPHG